MINFGEQQKEKEFQKRCLQKNIMSVRLSFTVRDTINLLVLIHLTVSAIF